MPVILLAPSGNLSIFYNERDGLPTYKEHTFPIYVLPTLLRVASLGA
jgi:hypothetical protein